MSPDELAAARQSSAFRHLVAMLRTLLPQDRAVTQADLREAKAALTAWPTMRDKVELIGAIRLSDVQQLRRWVRRTRYFRKAMRCHNPTAVRSPMRLRPRAAPRRRRRRTTGCGRAAPRRDRPRPKRAAGGRRR